MTEMPEPTRSVSELPSPWAVPLLGHLPRIKLAELHHQLEGWAAELGPVYRLRLGFGDSVVLSDPALIAEVLRQRPAVWGRLGVFEPVFAEVGAHGLFSAEGEDWQRQRRLAMHAFNPAQLARYQPQVEAVTERLRSRWSGAAEAGAPIALQADLMRFTVDAVAGLAFGTELNTLGDEEASIQRHLDRVFPMLYRRANLPWPYWRHVKLPADHRFDAHLAEVHQAIRGFIAAARARLAADPQRAERPPNLLEALLTAGREPGERPFTDTEIAGNVFTFLLGGEDTTAHTLAWALHLLHRHPAAWRALVAAVDDGSADALLDAVIHETLRLKPVAPFIALQSRQHTALGDVLIPARMPLLCLMRPGAMDAGVAPEPAAFRPERWLGDAAAKRTLKQVSMPFGAGARLCPGRLLAMNEMKLVLAMLARHFELLHVGPTRAPDAEPDERMAFTMHPEALTLQLAPRRRPAMPSVAAAQVAA